MWQKMLQIGSGSGGGGGTIEELTKDYILTPYSNSVFDSAHALAYAFDGNENTPWASTSKATNAVIGTSFTKAVCVKDLKIKFNGNDTAVYSINSPSFTLYGTNNSDYNPSTATLIKSIIDTSNVQGFTDYPIENTQKFTHYFLLFPNVRFGYSGNPAYTFIYELQMYGTT